MLTSTILALLICTAAATLESALAGSGVRQRMAEYRMPAYSPSFAVWITIGVLFYAMCFIVLRELLNHTSFTPLHLTALALLTTVLLINALWNVLFFRWRALRASFFVFIPYIAAVAALMLVLARFYSLGAALLVCYCVYLIYATWWFYRLWRLNEPTMQPTAGRSND